MLLSVSNGWKVGAIAIALAFVVAIFGSVAFAVKETPHASLNLFQGFDGVSSTSKFQWLLWLISVLIAYVSLWTLRAVQGHFGALPGVSSNVLTVLGFSTVTMATAKGMKVSKLSGQHAAVLSRADLVRRRDALGTWAPRLFAPLLLDDQGLPDLSKVQMIAFTFVSVGIFLAATINQITKTPVVTTMPTIDSSLLALMGISQAGYLGKKLVTPEPTP